MAAIDVLGKVCDRLVEGMMFHSDHADLCRYMGFKRLTRLHEDGFAHDSKAYRKVRRLCVRRLGLFPSQGRQERPRTLDQLRSTNRVDAKDRGEWLKTAMADWTEWEDGTAETYRDAARRLWDMGEAALSLRIAEMADDTEDELAEARDLWCRLDACCWDATIA